VLTTGGFESIPDVCPLDAGCATYADTATVRLRAGSTGRRARADLVGRGWAPVPEPSTVDNLRQAGAVPLVLAGFLALLGGGGLAHAVVVSLRARRRDLSVVRSLGLGARAARGSLRWAAVMLALAGAVVGVPLGLLLGRAVWDTTADSLGVVHEHALPLVAVPLVVIVMAALALALAELPARRAGHVRPAEILRSE
jgi:predicted lysophospholipase L1 biosynthesis ABC-type transport system permease subunit